MEEKILTNIVILVVVGLIVGGGLYYFFIAPNTHTTTQINMTVQPPANSTPLAPALQNMTLVVILDDNCTDCTAPASLGNQLTQVARAYGLNPLIAQPLHYPSTEANTLISRYKITKIPTMIVSFSGAGSNNISSVWTAQLGTMESDGNLVLRNVNPPYFDLQTQKVVGFVDAIAINANNCKWCVNASSYIDSLAGSPLAVAFSSNQTLDENSATAQALIAQYNITKLPALLLSSDVTAYTAFDNYVLAMGDIENNTYVLRNVMPPYVDLAHNKSIVGLVSQILIKNSSCINCTNLTQLSNYLTTNFGVAFVNTTTYEIGNANATALIRKYNITSIPVMIYSPEMAQYEAIHKTWVQTNNTIESDGSFVFRVENQTGLVYQNIATPGTLISQNMTGHNTSGANASG